MRSGNVFLALGISICLLTAPVLALAVPYENPLPEDYEKGCIQLDQEITELVYSTYIGKPGFNDDQGNALAAAIASFHYSTAFLYWIYNEAEKYGIQERIENIEHRIDVLRLVKAQKRCFED